MVQNINIVLDEFGDLDAVIKAIQRYYPIGLEIRNEQHGGFQEIQRIVEEKLSYALTNDYPEPLRYFRDLTQEIFNAYPLFFDFHTCFPSYSVTIDFLREDFPTLMRMVRIHLKISLLTDFYTILVEEEITHKHINLLGDINLRSVVIAKKALVEPGLNAKFEEISSIMGKCFPKHTYIDHYPLFTRKILYGVPYFEDQDEPERVFSLYSFVFGRVDKNARILE